MDQLAPAVLTSPAKYIPIQKSSPKLPQAIVFDCDGVLVDTETRWTIAEKSLFSRYGRTFTLEDKQMIIGKSAEEASRILAILLDQPGRELELVNELYNLLEEQLNGVSALPGVIELVRRAQGTIPIGVATNCRRSTALKALTSAGLVDAFDVIISMDDVTAPKPSPEPYLAACAALGADPKQSIALEDSPPGAQAAREAGMFVIGVPALTSIKLDADLITSSLADPIVAQVLFAGAAV